MVVATGEEIGTCELDAHTLLVANNPGARTTQHVESSNRLRLSGAEDLNGNVGLQRPDGNFKAKVRSHYNISIGDAVLTLLGRNTQSIQKI